ncbi:hypothetical protein LPJ70_004781, partial [Coemansia sp. RSA 2708]
RSNAAESDHRNIMTPEFRAFCIASREHVICCATLLVLFILAYLAVQRACTRPPRPAAPQSRSAAPRSHSAALTRRLAMPHSTVFRSRQISLAVAAAGLAAAAMTAVLLAATIALANAMEHGDLRSWRTWLLPATLLAPGDAAAAGRAALGAGPHVAHDFPPILRRLWRYQSVAAVGAAAFLLPLGVLFEATSRRATTRRRLLVALLRWLAAATLALALWEAACRRSGRLSAMGAYRPLSATGATMRYSIHYGACVFGLVPAVLAIVPRGTWALFAWLRSCVGHRHKLAKAALQRFARLQREQSRIERQLQLAIGSWKWERFHDTTDLLGFEDLSDTESRPEPPTRHAAPQLPPAHPGLARKPAKDPRQHQTIAFRRSGAPQKRTTARAALSLAPSTLQMDNTSPTEQDSLHCDGAASPHSPVLYYSDNFDSSDDGMDDSHQRYAAKRLQRRLQRAREREMHELSRKIQLYHAQLVFIRDELARLDASGILDSARNTQLAGLSGMAAVAKMALSLLAIAATVLCWLLVVLQIAYGALNAIFVGEPDLTSSYTYFMPALVASNSTAPPVNRGTAPFVPKAGWLQATLISVCQLASGALLFVVVLFGVLSMGSTVESSVLPVRAVAASHAATLIRARQWAWLPRMLPARVLGAIDPAPAARLLAEQPRVVAGSTSRAFFTSSADLTSYYRQLQREATLA